MSQEMEVAREEELQDGDRKSIVIDDDIPALLIKAGGSYYCIEDVCTHDGQPLTDGPVEDCEIECPRHGAKFDLKSGKATCMPATEPVRTFEVTTRDGAVFVAY